jgi:stage II sporulation protein D
MTSIRRTASTFFAALALLAPAAADASWKVKGHGFGHGVGMSQYGAFGLAEHGRNYRHIVGHYFAHTKLGHDGGTVRVLLGSGEGAVGFSGAGKGCGRRINPRGHYTFEVSGGQVILGKRGGGRVARCGTEGKASAGVRIAGFGRYRGSLVARATGGNILVINQLGSEAYVRGVVPNEVPPSWPAAALEAQAVVARSYGLATERSGPFDQYADTRSQVYGGKSSETPETNSAVKATSKQIVTYDGKPAITYYFSTSGGRTENSEYGFAGGNAVPYLKSVEDPFDDASPVHNWKLTLSDERMESKLNGLFGGRLKKIEVLKTGVSPRIVRARVVGSRSSSTVTGDVLRSRLGLMSTWARFAHR